LIRLASTLALLVTRVALADHHDAPWRRMTLQWSQMGLTEGLTFMIFLFAVFAGHAEAWGVTSRPV
jgi:hypothetical protein